MLSTSAILAQPNFIQAARTVTVSDLMKSILIAA